MINEHSKTTGRLLIQLFGADGKLKDQRDITNLIPTAGKGWIAQCLGPAASRPAQIGWMAVGTGTTAPAAGDTTLQAEMAGSRTALTTPGGSVAGNVDSYTCSFGAGVGTGAITEAGLFNASSAGTMVARTVFSAINKAAGDTLTISWSITNS